MSDAIPILNSVLHVAAQAVCAVGVARVIDYASLRVSSMAHLNDKVTKWNEAVVSALEVGAQILVSSIVLGLVYNYLAQLSAEAADPTSGSIFAYLLFSKQRHLNSRLDSLLEYTEKRLLSAEDSLMNGANNAKNIASPAADSAQGQRTLNRKLQNAALPRNDRMHALKSSPSPQPSRNILGY